MSDIERTRQLIAKALSRPVSEINEDVAMGSLASWDSLGHMRILLEIEALLGHEIDSEQAVDIIDFASVQKAIS